MLIYFLSPDISIRKFLQVYRDAGLGQVSLKMHILEDHTFTQITRFKSGLGKLNEEGVEATHADQNKDARRAYNLQHQPLKRLQFLMKEHLVKVHPNIRDKSLHGRKKRKLDQ